MTEMDVDTETYVLFPLFALGAAASLGLIGSDILPVVNLGDTFITAGGITWTFGRVLSLAALVGVIVNRDEPFQFSGWGTIELWTLYVTIGLVVAPPFFPALQDVLVAGPLAALVSFLVQSIGFNLITYIN